MDHKKQKKAQRIASVIYLILLAIVVGGTYVSEQKKLAVKNVSQNSSVSDVKE